MTHTQPDHTKRYTVKDFYPFVKRQSDWDSRAVQELPNLEPITLAEAFNRVAHSPEPYLHGYIKLGIIEGWGTLWMDTLQSGNWNGSGIVALSYHGSQAEPKCYRFALCKHEDTYMSSANPMRGLHDKFCTKCGLDTSVDSSD